MAIENGSTEYKIKRPFEYYSKEQKGDLLADGLELREASYEHSKYAFKIQQMITKLLVEIRGRSAEMSENYFGEEVKPMHEEAKSIEENSDGMADSISIGMMMSDKIDVAEFVSLWSDMATMPAKKPIVLIDGKVALSVVTIERMDPNDVLGAAVRWAAFFGMPSWMQNNASAGRSE